MRQMILALLAALFLAPPPSTTPSGQISTGTNIGQVVVRLGVPEFQPKSNDAQTVRLTAVFNQVLWDDLDYSGSISLISRSFQPMGKFQAPTDIKVEDWTKAPVNAQYLAFGNAAIA